MIVADFTSVKFSSPFISRNIILIYFIYTLITHAWDRFIFASFIYQSPWTVIHAAPEVIILILWEPDNLFWLRFCWKRDDDSIFHIWWPSDVTLNFILFIIIVRICVQTAESYNFSEQKKLFSSLYATKKKGCFLAGFASKPNYVVQDSQGYTLAKL